MTILQQTTTDLAKAQASLQKLYEFQRFMRNGGQEHTLEFRVLKGHIADYESEVEMCNILLENIGAQND
jgi:hypothetical protein